MIRCMWLAIGLLLLNAPRSVACPVLSEPEELQQAAADEAEARLRVRDLWQASDIVFVGRVLSTAEHSKAAAESSDGAVDGTVEEATGEVIAGELVAAPVRVLRGRVDGEIRLTYVRDESVFERSCTAIPHFRRISVRPTFRYLFYVKGGEVLRANEVVDWFHELDAESELKFLGQDH
jgi:hypothetical protein